MKTHKFSTLAFDRMASVRRVDEDGRMYVSMANISKANVCDYFGAEVPNSEALGLDQQRIYKLFRDPVELGKAVGTFNNLPLLNQHALATADDPMHELVIGSTGTDAIFEYPYLRNSLVIWDSSAIAAIESGDQKEISCAYRYDADMTPGIHEGVKYDGRMINVRGSHVAVVPQGRAGADVVVGDSNPFEGNNMTKKQRLIAAQAGARIALSGLIAQDADLSLLDKMLAKLGLDAEPEKKDDDENPFAKDAEEDDDEEDDPDNPGQKRKKVAAAADTDDEPKPEVTKAAMDAAIAKAVTAATKATMISMEALHTARKDVAHMVGEVAMDSAEAVYKFALDHAKVDTTGVHPSAYRALVKMAGAAPVVVPRVAMDAAATDSFTKRFPTAGNIIRS